MDFRLELVYVPVSDVDRAKAFYTEKAGFNADHDYQVSDEMRFVQLTPPGSACSIAIGTGLGAGPADGGLRHRGRPLGAGGSGSRRRRGPALPLGRLHLLPRPGRQRLGSPEDPAPALATRGRRPGAGPAFTAGGGTRSKSTC